MVTEQCRDPATLIVVAILAAAVFVLVVVVLACYCYYNFKHRNRRRGSELELIHEEQREQEDENDNRNHEVREQATCTADDTELTCEFIKQQTQWTIELLGLSSVQVDREVELNEEIEKERNEQALILLKHIFKRGRRNSSLKQDILDTINVEGIKVISQDDTTDIARHCTAGLPDDIHKYDAVEHSDIPPPFVETCARGIASPDECEAVWGDHHLCTNPLS